MKIESSQIQLAAQHVAAEQTEVKESLRVWVGDRTPESDRGASVAVSLSHEALSLSASASRMESTSATMGVNSKSSKLKSNEELEIDLLEKMFEKLLGRKFKFKFKFKLYQPEEFRNEKAEAANRDLAKVAAQAEQVQNQERQGWGMTYDRVEEHVETEQTSFSAEGVIKTEDGQEIKFSVDLSMSRAFAERNEIHLEAGDAEKLKDPLIINFNGSAADLTADTFRFDIDADGTEDQVTRLGENSAFIALDKNEDGVVNDGTELFGAKTGNGFAELGAYDEDKNQWIDENDSVYDKLRIWTVNQEGVSSLLGLGQAGVGALFLGNAETPFSVKDASNDLLGQVRATGVYLNENGSVGTLQQVDLKA